MARRSAGPRASTLNRRRPASSARSRSGISSNAEATSSKHPQGLKLQDCADLVLDTGAPPGDAMVTVPGLTTPVAPGSTIGGCLLVNAIKAEVAARLTAAGRPPLVLTGSALVGPDRAAELFEAAYDEHARRLAALYANLGKPLEPAD